ncbi:MAG: hypothetical protein ACYSTY_12090, partial [Planctomycetota bacterium]
MGGGHQLRRGGAFVLVLAASLLVTVLGTAALLAARLEHRAIASGDDMAEARTHAWSAINVALLLIDQDANWRTTYGNSNWPTDRTIGEGTFTIEASDPVDADVEVGPSDPVLITGIGLKNKARHKIQVRLAPPYGSTPLALLNTAAHSGVEVDVRTGATLTLIGASVSSNDFVTNESTILGDVETVNTVTNNGFISGTISASSVVGTGTPNTPTFPGVPVKEMPQSTVFEMYQDMATQLPFSGAIRDMVLAPNHNGYGGGLNAEGVYYIDTGGLSISIDDARIHGTLVVNCAPGTVDVSDDVFMHPYRPDYPVLLVWGEARIRMDSHLIDLDEAASATNFNPFGAPYQGETDTDQLDTYPNEIRGLIHVSERIRISHGPRLRGVALVGNMLEVLDVDNLFIHDQSLYFF